MQSVKVQCTVNAKNAIKCVLKKEQLSAKQQRRSEAKKRKYLDD